MTVSLTGAAPAETWARLLTRIREGASQRERARELPREAIAELCAAGFGALRVPSAEGGTGATFRGFFERLLELAAVDANVAHSFRSHFWFVEELRGQAASAPRSRWMEEIVAGVMFGGAAGEAGLQVGDADLGTTLRPAPGGGYRLDGAKNYTTGALFAEVIGVIAALPEQRFGVAVVPTGRSGVEIEDDWDGFGQRLTASGTIRFESVVVAAEEMWVYPLPGDDHPPARSPVTTFLHLYLTVVVAGILRAIADDAAVLLRGRTRTFTHAASDSPTADPLLLEVVGELVSEALAAEAIVLAAAEMLDAVEESSGGASATGELVEEAARRAAAAKIVVDRLGQRAATGLFDVAGASATGSGLNLDRHWRNIRTLASHNPATYKALAIGDLAVNRTPLPPGGHF